LIPYVLLIAGYDTFRVSDGSDHTPHAAGSLEKMDAPKASVRARVLVVDDERLIADTVAQILNMHGYDAFTAYGPDEALKLADRFRPDVLLTDVMMPAMNGLDLAAAMEKLFPAIKVLLFSGQAGSNALLQRRHIDDAWMSIVPKPIHPEKLVEALRALQAR
jgi:DNA-binding response OmpR family regulator